MAAAEEKKTARAKSPMPLSLDRLPNYSPVSPLSPMVRSATMYSNALFKQYFANGISLREKLFELFHSPELSLYRRSTDAFSIVTFRPSTVTSFSQSAQETDPARTTDEYGAPVQSVAHEHQELVDDILWNGSMLRGKEPVLIAICSFCSKRGLFRKPKHGVCLLQNAAAPTWLSVTWSKIRTSPWACRFQAR